MRVLEEPLDVSAAVRVEQLVQKARRARVGSRPRSPRSIRRPCGSPRSTCRTASIRSSIMLSSWGPKRSVRIAPGCIPRSSSRPLAVSTNPFDPHTNASCAPAAGVAQQVGVHVAGVAAPALRRLARVGEHGVVAQLVRVDHVVGVAHGVHETHVQLRHRAPLVPQHRHQRRHARAAAHQQHRRLAAPHEVGRERAAQLHLVAHLHDLVEVRRHLAVVEEVDGQLDLALVERGGGHRVGALRVVAVRSGEPDVVVLPREMRHPHRDVEAERLDPRRLLLDPRNRRDLPPAGCAQLDRRQSFQ